MKKFLHTDLPMKTEQGVPKRRHIEEISSYLPAYEDGTECSETPANKIHRQVGMKKFLHTYLLMKMEQSVPKRRQIKFIGR